LVANGDRFEQCGVNHQMTQTVKCDVCLAQKDGRLITRVLKEWTDLAQQSAMFGMEPPPIPEGWRSVGDSNDLCVDCMTIYRTKVAPIDAAEIEGRKDISRVADEARISIIKKMQKDRGNVQPPNIIDINKGEVH